MGLIVNPRYQDEYDFEKPLRIQGPTFCNATIPDGGVIYDPYQTLLDTWPDETDGAL